MLSLSFELDQIYFEPSKALSSMSYCLTFEHADMCISLLDICKTYGRAYTRKMSMSFVAGRKPGLEIP